MTTLSSSSGALTPFHHPSDDDPLPDDTGDGLREVADIPAGAGRIIGSPDAGPEPHQSGDRGGALQFATLGAVAAALALMAWRITRALRRSNSPARLVNGSQETI